MKAKKIKGVYTALTTPFDLSGQLDIEGFKQHLRMQLTSGVDGVVILGTTGEAPTLRKEEQAELISVAVEELQGKISLMVGTGTYSTEQTVENTRQAALLGADAALIITPYYNKPTQQGIYLHFSEIAAEVNLPIMVYNAPGRTGQNIHVDTLSRLAEIPNILGIKEASGNILQISEMIQKVAIHRPEFSLMSGDDPLTFSIMALGGDGVISVASNLIPRAVCQLVSFLQSEDYSAARQLHYQFLPFFQGLFIETNPIPIKVAMNWFGMPAGKWRLPLCEMSKDNEKTWEKIVNEVKEWIDQPVAIENRSW